MFRICPQKKKATFVASFGDNALFTMKELERQTDDRVVVMKTGGCRVDFTQNPKRTILLFEPRHFLQWIGCIYHLATSHTIFVDNYFGFLAAARFRKSVKCIQLWHAAGAIKQFGLKDPSNTGRSPAALDRFQQVYDQFDHMVVGSERMADIFCESFGLGRDHMLPTGIPRTDFFFHEDKVKEVARKFEQDFPVIREKKVILYAPTYRDNELEYSKLALDIEKMFDHLGDDHVLFLRLHPAVKYTLSHEFQDFAFDMSTYPDMNELLAVADCLITDYSSIPFEYALLQRPMVFFAYDLEEYTQLRGFWEPYEELVPGPIARNTDEVIRFLEEDSFDMAQITRFAAEWNEYSTGDSSRKLIQHVYAVKEQSAD